MKSSSILNGHAWQIIYVYILKCISFVFGYYVVLFLGKRWMCIHLTIRNILHNGAITIANTRTRLSLISVDSFFFRAHFALLIVFRMLYFMVFLSLKRPKETTKNIFKCDLKTIEDLCLYQTSNYNIINEPQRIPTVIYQTYNYISSSRAKNFLWYMNFVCFASVKLKDLLFYSFYQCVYLYRP